MTSAAIYARVSSARQKKDETIGSQTAALREHAAQARLDVPEEWVFEDEGHSGATLVRPALEALRDLAAQGCLDVVLCYSPDRLARKFAYQALLLEEFARAGVRAEFVKGPRRYRSASWAFSYSAKMPWNWTSSWSSGVSPRGPLTNSTRTQARANSSSSSAW